MKVKIPICYKNGNESYKRTIEFVNPNCSDDDLRDFIIALNNLTTNQLTEALKVVSDFCSRSGGVTPADITKIFDGTYTIETVEGGIVESDIDKIFDGSFIIETVDGGISESDVDNIF